MKIIGNHNGEWLVDDGVDETSDGYQCELIAEDVRVTGDPQGDCTVIYEVPMMSSYGRHSDSVRYQGTFIGGELRGHWGRLD